MKRTFWTVLAVLGLLVTGARATQDGTTSFQSCTRVQVSTTPASPTTLLSTNRSAKRTQVYLNPFQGDAATPTATDAVMLGDGGVTFSTQTTSGTFRLRANTWWSPDAYEAAWQGKLQAVSLSTGPVNMDVCQEQ